MLKKIALLIVLVLMTSCTSSTKPNAEEITSVDQVYLDSPTSFRIVKGNIERRAKSGSFFSSDSRVEKDFDPIRVKAYASFQEFLSAQNSENLELAIVVRPDVPKDIANYSVEQVRGAARFWGSRFPMGTKLDVLFVSEKDDEYMDREGREFVTSLDNYNRLKEIDSQFGNSWIMGEVRSNRSTNQFNSKLILATTSFADTDRMDNGWIQVPAHETFHVIFDYYMSQKPVRSEGEYLRRAPQYFIEGAANYFGYSYAMKNLGWYSDGLDVSLSVIWKSLGTWRTVKTESDVIELLKATEGYAPQQAFEASYAIGAIFTEWIVAEYGFEALMRILENLAKSDNFDQNLKSSIGIDKDEAYRKAAPYLLSIFTRLKIS